MASISSLANYYRTLFVMLNRLGFSRRATVTAKMMRDDGQLFLNGLQAKIILPTTQDFSVTNDITKALDNAAIPDTWTLTGPIGSFGSLDVDGQTMMRPNAAVINVIDQRIGYNIQAFHEAREQRIWSDSTGALGQVGTITGTTTVTTPVNGDTYWSVPPNATVVFNPTRTGSAGTIRAITYKVTGKVLNADGTAQLTLTRLTGSTVPVSGDYIYVDGTYDSAPPGIKSFLPATAPTSGDSFLGTDRSNYPNLLSGYRFNFDGTIQGTLIKSFANFGRHVVPELIGDRFTVCMSAGDFARLQIEQQGQVRFMPDSLRRFGTQAIAVATAYGDVPCVTIPAILDGDQTMYGINWDSWHNAPVGTVPHIMEDDGLVFARIGYGSTAQDAVSMRLRAYDMLFCDKPVSNFQAKTA